MFKWERRIAKAVNMIPSEKAFMADLKCFYIPRLKMAIDSAEACIVAIDEWKPGMPGLLRGVRELFIVDLIRFHRAAVVACRKLEAIKES